MRVYIWLWSHSSSANSFAELRLLGSHCSILLIKRKKACLSSFPSRVLSLFSSGTRSVNKSGVRKSPAIIWLVDLEPYCEIREACLPSLEKNLLLDFPWARRLAGGGPRRLIISARCARLRYLSNSGSWPVNKDSPSYRSQIYNLVIRQFLHKH